MVIGCEMVPLPSHGMNSLKWGFSNLPLFIWGTFMRERRNDFKTWKRIRAQLQCHSSQQLLLSPCMTLKNHHDCVKKRSKSKQSKESIIELTNIIPGSSVHVSHLNLVLGHWRSTVIGGRLKKKEKFQREKLATSLRKQGIAYIWNSAQNKAWTLPARRYDKIFTGQETSAQFGPQSLAFGLPGWAKKILSLENH